MLKIGCHLSSSKGYEAMGKTALSINANTFQFFTRNPRGGKAKDINPKDIEKYLEFAKKHNIVSILAHAPYTLNAAAKDEGLREFAKNTMADDLLRMEYTPGNCYNFHPGSHVGQGTEAGITYIADMLNSLLTPQQTTIVLLETMSGKGTELGRNFEELREIIDRIHLKEKVGVCLDTCHIWDGGYDIVNHPDEVIAQFDSVIGLSKLKAIHLNDSLNPLCSHKDRHAKIGQGTMGLDALVRIMNHPALSHLPFYLETPNELDGYEKEISILREHYQY